MIELRSSAVDHAATFVQSERKEDDYRRISCAGLTQQGSATSCCLKLPVRQRALSVLRALIHVPAGLADATSAAMPGMRIVPAISLRSDQHAALTTVRLRRPLLQMQSRAASTTNT